MTIEQVTDEAPKEQTLHVASLATGAITQGDDNTITEITSSEVRMNLTFNIFLKNVMWQHNYYSNTQNN